MRIPAGTAAAELIVKRSRFIGTAEPFHEPDAAKATVQGIRDRHPGCSHVVYAYIVGAAGSLFGLSDDGEPKGTAGRPVLEVLKGSGLTNTIVTVVRYFGGTKLGTGGLVRAYSETARVVLSQLKTEELVEKVRFSLEVPYAMYAAARRFITDLAASIEEEKFGSEVSLCGELPAARKTELETGIADLSGGQVRPHFPDTVA